MEITLLIHYEVHSRFTTLIKLIYSPILDFNVLVLTLCHKIINFSFQILYFYS
jgi:hypothetical protein